MPHDKHAVTRADVSGDDIEKDLRDHLGWEAVNWRIDRVVYIALLAVWEVQPVRSLALGVTVRDLRLDLASHS